MIKIKPIYFLGLLFVITFTLTFTEGDVPFSTLGGLIYLLLALLFSNLKD